MHEDSISGSKFQNVNFQSDTVKRIPVEIVLFIYFIET